MATNINRVVLEGELSADPLAFETRTRLKLLVVGLRKLPTEEGEPETWVGKPNHFDIVVWGEQGVRCAAELRVGAKVVVTGRLEWIRGTDGIDKPIPARIEVVAEDVRILDEPVAAEIAPTAESEPEPETAAAA